MVSIIKIGVDVGGVISKHPTIFRALFNALTQVQEVEIWVVSDMHPVEMIVEMLLLNDIPFDPHHVVSADFKKHGERCKAVVAEQLGLDILIDDFPGYVGSSGKPPVRLLVMPDPEEPYYHDTWRTDGSEGDFGRRRRP